MRNIRSIFFLGAVLIAFGACQSTEETTKEIEPISIIPQPVKVKLDPGSFTINNSTVVNFNNESLQSVAEYMIGKLSKSFGFRLQIEEGFSKGINLIILEETDENLGDEGYILKVTPNNIQVSANKPNGIFYGIQSLFQMLPPQMKSKRLQSEVNWEIQCAEIEDKPRFPWRGLMLDVSRHFFTKEEVKEYIDQLAEYKMNVFHWHLSDDQGWRIEIKSLPNLTEKGAWRAKRVGQWWQRTPRQEGEATDYGGFYTHEDIKEIVQFARERFVQIVPEIDVPGHSLSTIVAYPEISCTQNVKDINVGNKFYGIDENSLCVGKDLTFEYLDKIFTEISMLFPSEYVHVGGDECYKGFWSKCDDCQKRTREEKLKDTDELQSYFIKRVEKMLESKGKRLVGWDEILEGGLAPNATVMSWRGMSGGIKAAKEGHQVIMTPSKYCYLDLFQGEPSVEPDTYSMSRLIDAYSFEPVPEGVDPKLILGGQGNLWTESVPNFRHAQYMTWPRGWALAEVFWSPKDTKNWEDFVGRVENNFVRADFGEIKYSRSMYNAIVTPFLDENSSVKIKLETEIHGMDIYYTFDNTDPDHFSKKYNSPLLVPKNATWLKVVTFQDRDQVGKIITLRIDELRERVKE